ncbi:PAS domain S-box protein [Halomicroarcula sp. F13]|uniref:histidine kinase n=1 Tax=Haloarcula rubra TaxID=2487747 RepID=A0AAW4PZP7_9EURY|nr:PAS domain S-box protein [Halomicroarcula rubra]MBX0325722.1 PAS domain S-box protein [Halomicroarcula rubra]
MSSDGEIRVLHVDDEPEFGDVAAMHLERVDGNVDVATEQDACDALDRLRSEPFDCVVSDHDMPDMDGLELLKAVREEFPELPFILFTGKGNEEIASDAISAGVTEYLQKDVGTDQYTVLANRIRRAVGETRAKAALEESERQLSTLISNLPGMVYRARNEPGWPMEFVSDGAEELVGYESATIESGEVSWGDLIVDAETDRLWEQVQTCLAADEPFEVTYRVETADGETRWLWERGRVVDTDDEGVELLEGFVTDITARKQRERELEQERQFTETLVDAIDDVFYLVGPEGELLRWNDTVLDVTGYTNAELASMNAFDLFPEAYHDVLVERLEETVAEGQSTLELPVETKGGELLLHELRGSLIEDPHGDVLGIAGIARDITERKARERKLERYETLVENVGDPMFVLDERGHIQMANRIMAEYLGADRDEIVGTPASEYIAAEDHEEGLRDIRDLLSDPDRTWASHEMTVTTTDGETRQAENKVAVLTDSDGEFTGSVGVVRDITERKARERKLEQYETLVENVGDAMYVLDSDGTIRMANDAMADHLGYDREEIVGAEPTQFMLPEDVQTATEIIERLYADPDRTWATFEMCTVDADGNRTVNENKVAPLVSDEGEFVGSVGVIRDVTERIERERELERYETIVEAVDDPVYTLDDEGVFTFVNEAIEPMTGYSPDDLVGQHIGVIMTDEGLDRGEQVVQDLLTDEEADSATLEMDVVTRDGATIPSENNMALLPAPDGEFAGTAGVVRDIAERKEREERLAEFASVVSHDLRNPLNVVQGRIALAEETGDIDHLGDAAGAADRMERLIEDLLSLARQGQTVGSTERVDVGTAAEQAWANVDTDGAALECPDTTTVEADPARLRELLENLFRNSIEHSDASGRSEDAADRTTGGGESATTAVTVTVDTMTEGASTTGFVVADDGPGIPASKREQIFERGYTTSESGTGFGLAIVEDIATAHGWTVDATESEAGGARFEFRTTPADR